MSQSQRIVAATKQALREHGLTYADVAAHIDLSEASVKRMFAQERFSLERLEAVAGLMELELGELVQKAEAMDPLPRELTIDQEQSLVQRPEMLMVLYLLLNNYDLDRIVAEYRIERPQGVLILRELERLGVLEHRPGDRIRLLVSRNLSWRRDGPIREFIDGRVLREFLGGDFDGASESYHFVSGLVTPEGLERLQGEIERLIRRFNEQIQGDSERSPDRRTGSSLMVALRPWRFSLFAEYERSGTG